VKDSRADDITLKLPNSILVHDSEETITTGSDSRAPKGQYKRKVLPSVEQVRKLKADPCTTRDAIRATIQLEKIGVKYQQAYRVLRSVQLTESSEEKAIYQKIIPYLHCLDYETDALLSFGH
jgi:hypothetical protein